MTYTLSQRSRDNMIGLHPDMVRIVGVAIGITTCDFGVTGKAVRTAAEQHALYLKGVTQKDGYKSKSNHQPWADGLGHAIDLTPYVGGKFIITEDAWDHYPKIASAMSVAAKSLGLASRLKWGCDWYRAMDEYGSGVADMLKAIEHYKAAHPGTDFIDGPHFEYRN